MLPNHQRGRKSHCHLSARLVTFAGCPGGDPMWSEYGNYTTLTAGSVLWDSLTEEAFICCPKADF